jgi:sulfoxide reductase heme-binding subunit YedZ
VLASLSLTWVTARAAGFTAFALLSSSVALGLVLSSPVRSERWPRFVTTELHRFATLLSLVFIAVHVLVVRQLRFHDPPAPDAIASRYGRS